MYKFTKYLVRVILVVCLMGIVLSQVGIFPVSTWGCLLIGIICSVCFVIARACYYDGTGRSKHINEVIYDQIYQVVSSGKNLMVLRPYHINNTLRVLEPIRKVIFYEGYLFPVAVGEFTIFSYDDDGAPTQRRYTPPDGYLVSPVLQKTE